MAKLYPRCSGRSLFSAFFLLILFQAGQAAAQIIYVDSAAVSNSHTKDGLSWSTAFDDLQDALATATSGAEIRLAKGTYYPTNGTDRSISFELISGVAIYGGYSANTAIPDERDVHLYRTILSGDLNEDDGDLFTNRTDNSYTVVYAQNVSASTRLDGLTISSGNADDNNLPYEDRNSSGGGIFNDGRTSASVPTLFDCIIEDNQAQFFGAGIFNDGSTSTGNTNLLIQNCLFQNNRAE
ncbi:MAG: hypothetical protein AAFP19_24900, partial [Bacteroidota bacterium]